MTTMFQSYSSGGKSLFQVFRISGKNRSQSLNHNTNVTFQFILRGEGKYFINDHCYGFRRNCMLVSRPNDNQRCMPKPGCRMDKICLRFPVRIIGDYLPLSVYRSLPHVISLSGQEAVTARLLMQSIYNAIKMKPVYWYKGMLCEIWGLIMHLYRCAHRNLEKPEAHPVLKQILDYIEKHFRSDINIQSLCKQLGFSVDYLSHLFLAETGMGIRHYILQRRIAEAKLLLNSRHQEVRAIARAVGYGNIVLFLYQFKTYTGLTPEEYRSVLFDETADQRAIL